MNQYTYLRLTMYHFCTITTADHLFKTLALYDSIREIDSDSFFHVLCIDTLPANLPTQHIAFYSPTDIADLKGATTIISKYSNSKDKLRWSFKPIFLNYLLENKCDKVLYADNDIYFFSSYTFLFDLLDENNFLLTPHNYPRDPNKNQNWLEANYRVGLYNAGFIGVNKDAIPTLQWWAACCAYRCEKNVWRGTFDDQKYLDLVPVMNEKAHIIRHKGCNVAEWNKEVIGRELRGGKVWLDGKDELVFVHFNGTTIRTIQEGVEPCLEAAFQQYYKTLQKYKTDVKVSQLFSNPSWLDNFKYSIWKTVTDLGF